MEITETHTHKIVEASWTAQGKSFHSAHCSCGYQSNWSDIKVAIAKGNKHARKHV